MIKINEIFYSIQGESSRVGLPTVFIRTSGCPLRCTYCDTQYAYYNGESMEVEDILKEVCKHKTPYVCVTGGEPLIQKETHTLLKTLCENGYEVSLETSGNMDCSLVDSRVLKVIDVKTPDSGAFNSFDENNLNLETVNTEFKFVICSDKDFLWAEDFIKKHKLSEKFSVLYSPSYGDIDQKWLAEKILLKSSNARLQLQLHKYIWSPDTQGV